MAEGSCLRRLHTSETCTDAFPLWICSTTFWSRVLGSKKTHSRKFGSLKKASYYETAPFVCLESVDFWLNFMTIVSRMGRDSWRMFPSPFPCGFYRLLLYCSLYHLFSSTTSLFFFLLLPWPQQTNFVVAESYGALIAEFWYDVTGMKQSQVPHKWQLLCQLKVTQNKTKWQSVKSGEEAGKRIWTIWRSPGPLKQDRAGP